METRAWRAMVTTLVVTITAGCDSTTADRTASVARGQCARQEMPAVDLPDGFVSTNVGYFAQCDSAAASDGIPLGNPWMPIEVYGDPDGGQVVAWWYQDCGVATGMVVPGAPRPECDPAE